MRFLLLSLAVILTSCSNGKVDCSEAQPEMLDLSKVNLHEVSLRSDLASLLAYLGDPERKDDSFEESGSEQYIYSTRGISFYTDGDSSYVAYVDFRVLDDTLIAPDYSLHRETSLRSLQNFFPVAYACRRTFEGEPESNSKLLLRESSGRGWITFEFDKGRLISLDYGLVR